MQRNIILAALALAALCAFSTPAMAQRGYGGRGGYGGYRGGYGGYRGGYGGYRGGYYGGYRGYGYGPGLAFGAGVGTGLIIGNAVGGYGYGYAPYYGGYDYAPPATYVVPATPYVTPPANYVVPNGISSADRSADASRDSLYYGPETADNTARLRILAPADAKVWVGGVETGQVGSEREFASPPLAPGRAYTYEVKARWNEAGEPREKTQKVRVEANRTTTVDFDAAAAPAR